MWSTSPRWFPESRSELSTSSAQSRAVRAPRLLATLFPRQCLSEVPTDEEVANLQVEVRARQIVSKLYDEAELVQSLDDDPPNRLLSTQCSWSI